MKIDFTGKSVLVTGGTRGIGKAIALGFIEAHAHKVVITGTAEVFDLTTTFGECEELFYEKIDFLSSNAESVVKKISQRYEGFDIIVNNAGINQINSIEDFNLQAIEDVVRVNLIGPAMVIGNFSSYMIKNKYGRIVNISSIFGEVSKEKRFNYSSSKAGLIGQTRSLALDLAKYGILVNSVGPGFIGTELTQQVLGQDGVREMVSQVPLGRLGEPEEIAKLVLFLSSDQNSFITGQNIVADGGFLAK